MPEDRRVPEREVGRPALISPGTWPGSVGVRADLVINETNLSGLGTLAVGI